jgi:gluconate 5-dehydrogenase
MAQHGARVILNGRNAEKLESRMRDLEKEGLKASGYVFDVSRADEVKTACKQMEKELGPIDILVNNAGITVRTSLEEFKDEDWENILDVNLKGAYLVAKAIVPSMIKRRCGKIINIGSVQSELGRPGNCSLCRIKGRDQNADQRYGGGLGQIQHPNQWDWPRIFQDRNDPGIA